MTKFIIFLISLFSVFSIASSLVQAQGATDSAESIREKVKEKIQDALKNPKAYLGTITDKTGETLQIKNPHGEIQFISVNPEKASFVSVGKTSKTIKYTDVAIGDFIIAMGFKNGNNVLTARRILVTEAPSAPERKIIFGKVSKIDKKVLTVITGGVQFQTEFPKTWKGPEIKEISENDMIALVSVPSNGKNVIRTLEIITKSQNPSPTPKE